MSYLRQFTRFCCFPPITASFLIRHIAQAIERNPARSVSDRVDIQFVSISLNVPCNWSDLSPSGDANQDVIIDDAIDDEMKLNT